MLWPKEYHLQTDCIRRQMQLEIGLYGFCDWTFSSVIGFVKCSVDFSLLKKMI